MCTVAFPYHTTLKMSSYRQLILLCVKALSTFDPDKTGVDSHLQSFLRSPEHSLSDDADRVFVSEVFAGCVHYQAVVKVVVNGYYAKDGRTCLRADSNLYTVLAYLVMFRLEELGMGHFRRLISSQHTGKMHKFFSFFFNENSLRGWIRDEWCKVYDQGFVETTLMSPILRFEPEMREFIEQLSDKLASRAQAKRTTKPVTETKPFNLTRPHPRSVPTPERIPTLKAYKPVPHSTYSRPTEMARLAQAREDNRKRAEEALQEAERLQFLCANTEKSQKTKAIMEDIVAEREAKLQYSPRKPAPVPAFLHESRPVKLNAAAILREGARVQREGEEEERRLASLEAGQRDASEFIRWQEEMKQKGAAEKLADIEKKHLEGQLSYEEAIIARQKHFRENRELVNSIKEESDQLMRQYFVQREGEQRELRRLVEATMAGHQGTREARIRLQRMKQKIVQQVAKESQEIMARALEEAEAEMRRKAELIQQIRAMESVPLIRTRFVDLTETAGQGLLAEMSVSELRERLALMRVAAAEEEERRRREITAAKQAKEQLLTETRENISRHRAEQSLQTAAKQEQQRQTFSRHHAELKDKQLSSLQEKLEARRREKVRLWQEMSGVAPASAPTSVKPHPSEHTSQCNKEGDGRGSHTKSRAGSLQTTPVITTLLRTASKSTVT